MKTLNTIASCALALCVGQTVLGVDAALGTVSSPFLTSTGLSSSAGGNNREAAEKMGLEEADVQAIRQGRMTDRIRSLASESKKTEVEAMQILQDQFGVE